MKPLNYDFPDRMRGRASGGRELARLERSIGVAEQRGDKLTVDYLTRRHQRASDAYRALCSRLRPAKPSAAIAGRSDHRAPSSVTESDPRGGG